MRHQIFACAVAAAMACIVLSASRAGAAPHTITLSIHNESDKCAKFNLKSHHTPLNEWRNVGAHSDTYIRISINNPNVHSIGASAEATIFEPDCRTRTSIPLRYDDVVVPSDSMVIANQGDTVVMYKRR
jgi:hypothetical protein